MSRIVHVQHPVPIRHVPKGARRERLSFGRIATPVELPEVAPEAMTHVRWCETDFTRTIGYKPEGGRIAQQPLLIDRRKSGFDLFAHGGALWQRLRGRGGKDGARAALTPDDLAGFLAGGHDPKLLGETDLGEAFTHTPVLGLEKAKVLITGAALEAGDSRHVVEDGSAAAARDVARFVRENVLVAGDAAYMRFMGPLVAATPFHFLPMPFPRHFLSELVGESLPCRIDRLDMALPLLRDFHHAAGQVRWLKGVMPEQPRDDDFHFVAHKAPLVVAKFAEHAIKEGPDWRADGAHPLERDLEALRPWHGRAMLGAIAPEEFEDVLSVSSEVLSRVRRFLHGRKDHAHWAWVLDQAVLPRLRAQAPVPDEDVDAFAALGGPRP